MKKFTGFKTTKKGEGIFIQLSEPISPSEGEGEEYFKYYIKNAAVKTGLAMAGLSSIGEARGRTAIVETSGDSFATAIYFPPQEMSESLDIFSNDNVEDDGKAKK